MEGVFCLLQASAASSKSDSPNPVVDFWDHLGRLVS